MTKGSVLIWDYFPDYAKDNVDELMKSIVNAGGEVCLTYLKNSEEKDIMKYFEIISDKQESDLEKEFYPTQITKPIGSIIVAEKQEKK